MKLSWQKKLGCLVACLLLACCGLTCVWSMGIGEKQTTWEHFDSVQVLAGPDEMWLFLEVDRMIHLPGVMVSAPTRSIGHRQIVLVVGPDGEPRRTFLVPDNGTSFHKNLGHIFRHGDQTYLFEGASKYTRRSVFIWSDSRFELLPRVEGDELLRSNGLSELSPAEIDSALDELSNRSGWRSLMVETWFAHWSEAKGEIVALPEGSIEWAGRTFTWEQEASPAEIAVSLKVEAQGATKRIPVLRYDPRRVPVASGEADALRKPHQNGHPR